MTSFYVTTPIYYVNDVPHLGHAYTTIVADLLARYHRARGHEVYFLTGTDEHGQKIERAASARGEQPLELANRVVEQFKQTWQTLGIANDAFIRTTEERHRRVVQAIWTRMANAGDIYLGEYDGLYCVGCEEYFTESQLGEGGTCPVHGTPVEHLKQPSYFFRMSRYQDRLLRHIEENPDFIRPEIRRNEIARFVESGLRDLSISRTTFRWGIPVPGDPDHVIYVWVDALTNYISALGGFDGDEPLYRAFWPANLHLIGKDILRFHAVYWPTMLMSAGLPLPRRILAHGWWTINGQKMSKSLRNVVEPTMIAADVGRDALRYFLLRETPLGSDGDFSHDGLVQRINAELANDLGNLLKRSLAMAGRYCEGRVPRATWRSEADPVDAELAALARRATDEAAAHFEAASPSRALESIWELVRGANKYIDTTAPYKLVKDPALKPRLDEVMAHVLEALRWIALLLGPVMPDKAAEMERQLGFEGPAASRTEAWPGTWGQIPAGQLLAPGEALFPRIDDDRRAELMARWQAAAAPVAPEAAPAPIPQAAPAGSPSPATPPAPAPTLPQPAGDDGLIDYEHFARLDLRAATVLSAERVKKADKLLLLSVDVGEAAPRQVVAGVAEAYAPEALVGRQVILLANLKPARIRGQVSQGMILAAGEQGVLALSSLDKPVPPGTKIR